MSGRRDLAWVLVSAVVLATVAFGVRVPRGQHAYTSDEVGHFEVGDLAHEFWAQETGVNPPLFRMLTHGAPTPGARVEAGRAISVGSSALAAGLLVVAGALITGRWWAGALGAVPFAVVETSVRATAQARAYGLLALGTALFLVALHLWVRRPEDRRRQAAVAVAALPLAWIHYVTIPWLLALAAVAAIVDRSLRRLWVLLVPAGVAALPLVARILAAEGRRVAPSGTLGQLTDLLLGWNTPTPWQPWGWSTGLSVLTPWVALLWGLPLLAGRRLSVGMRVQVASTWSVVGILLAFHTSQAVRPPSLVFLLVVGGPALLTLPALMGRSWVGGLSGLAIVGALLWPQAERQRRGVERPYAQPDGVREFALQVRSGQLPEGEILISPQGQTVPFLIYLTGHLPARLPRAPGCPDAGMCVVVKGRVVRAADAPTPTARWVVDTRFQGPTMPGCEPWPLSPDGIRVWSCPNAGEPGATSTEP